MERLSQKPEPRGADGLTKAQRAESYRPENWTVEQLSETRYAATCRNGRWLLFTVAYGRIFGVETDRGTSHELVIGCCTCEDAKRGALDQNRLCAHAAAAEAVEVFLEVERQHAARAAALEASLAANRQRRAQAEINAVFGAEAIQHPRPADWARVVAVELELNPHLKAA